MVVKELVALLGVKTNKASVKKADGALKGIMQGAQKAMVAVAAIFAAARMFSAIGTFVQQASAVNETLNVLDAAFKENQNTVIAWADEYADVAGRSAFDMRQMAADLGAVLTPMMDDNADASARMSMRMAELAVDMASFFNASEPDVLRALRSGLTGEGESLKKYGIIMKTAALEAHALNMGIKGNFDAMSEAEKTAVRYSFFIEKTKAAHGDAAKTALGFANASKNLGAKLKDIGTRFGLNLIPSLEEGIQLLIGSTGALESVSQVASNFIAVILKLVVRITKFIKSTGPMTKGILGITVALMGIIGLMKLGVWGKWFLVIAAIALVLEDFQKFAEGGESAFGKLLTKAYEFLDLDPEQANYDQWLSDVQFFASSVADLFGGAATAVGSMFEEQGILHDALLRGDEAAVQASLARQKISWDESFASISRGMEKLFGVDFPDTTLKAAKAFTEVWVGVADWFSNLPGRIIESWKTDFTNFAKWVKEWMGYLLPGFGNPTGGNVKKPSAGVQGAMALAGGGAQAGVDRPGPWITSGAEASRPGPWIDNTTNNVVVEVKPGPGMSEEKLAAAVGREVPKHIKKEKGKENRKAMRALSTSRAPAI